jgi:hypothetical protein
MANSSISGLTASVANLASTDLVPVVQTAGVGPVKMTGAQIRNPRVVTTSNSAATVAWSIDAAATDMAVLTDTYNGGAATGVTISTTGTPVDGQRLTLRIYSANTLGATLTFSPAANFVGSTDIAIISSATGNGKYDYVGFVWNNTASKWQMVSVVKGF